MRMMQNVATLKMSLFFSAYHSIRAVHFLDNRCQHRDKSSYQGSFLGKVFLCMELYMETGILVLQGKDSMEVQCSDMSKGNHPGFHTG